MVQCSSCMHWSPSLSCEQSIIPSGPSTLSKTCAMVISRGDSTQQISALGTIVTFNQSGFRKCLKNLGQQFNRDIVFLGDFFCIDDPGASDISELNRCNVLEGHQAIVSFF